MSPQAQLTAFAQSIYLTIKNRYFDEIEGEDGQNYILQVMDWTNMFLDEIENITDANGNLVDWNWYRQMGYELGTANEGEASFDVDREVGFLLPGEQRYVQILQDGTAVSNWAVVTPDQISNRRDRIVEDTVTQLGSTLVFSRAFKDTENGGTVIGDVSISLPRMTKTNVRVLNIVKPKTLLVLGVAKNATLPDIVQGGLSPSYVQKYNDLLTSAIARNSASSLASIVQRDSYGGIRGVGF